MIASPRKPLFWVVLLALSLLCAFTVFRYFGQAFSVLDLDVRFSREQAVEAARHLAAERKLASVPPTDSAVAFGGDATVQTFVELAGGGKDALKPLLGGDEFTLYRWRVRLFTPGEEREVQFAFTPDGRPAGFFVRVPEREPGPALAADDARALAVATASRDWQVDFSRYRALDASSVTRPGGRVDHEFIYERLPGTAPAFGDGRLRLRLLVAGDRLVQLQRFFHVPEAFVRRYETMRSANNTIATFASVTAGLLYGLGGCLLGLIWLMRRREVRWRPAAKWAALVAVLITGMALSAIPGSWFGYDTATSAAAHRYGRIAQAAIGGVLTWLVLTVIFATAEGLGRMAFGSHPQLWRTWHRPAANSGAIWGRTLAGYAWIGFELAFIAGFYFLVQRHLGWWSPSDAIVDPNILGTAQPWIAPVAMALQAGTMEEALFRAVPLAGAALIGRRFGRERLFVVIALVVQAVVFGCAHANYPGQPAYARPVELFVPSLVWGLVYLRYGLVPGMLFHFGFDLVLMSMPLFVTDVPGIAFDRAMVVAVFAFPLLVLVVQRLRAGRFVVLPASERNAAGREPMRTPAEDVVLDAVDKPRATAGASISRGSRLALVAMALVGIAGTVAVARKPYDAPPLAIDRDQAIALAERALGSRGVVLDARWHRSARSQAVADAGIARFVYREGGADLYRRLIGNLLPPPHWEVRFARFDGDVTEREAWRVVVVDDRGPPDGIRVIEHVVPEARAGARLTEVEARAIADNALAAWFHRAASTWRPVSAASADRPARTDWNFVYADPGLALPAGAEARAVVQIDGDQVSGIGRRVFIPDAWQRQERQRDERLLVPRGIGVVLGLAITVGFLVSVVRRMARREASARAAWVGGLLVAGTLLVGVVLTLNAARSGFSITEPYDDQMLRVWLRGFGVAAMAGLFGALVAAVGVRIVADNARMLEATTSRNDRWFAAGALALFAVGIGGIGHLLASAKTPDVPSTGELDASLPWLAHLAGSLDFVTGAALVAAVAAMLSSRRRGVAALIALVFVALPMVGAFSVRDAVTSGVVVAGVAGGLSYLVYRTFIRDRYDVIAPMLLVATVLMTLVLLVRPGSGLSIVDAASGLLGNLIGYVLWRLLVKHDAERRTV